MDKCTKHTLSDSIGINLNHSYYYDLCRITDLGLSRPANEEEKEDRIYGLMPYMAPEILRGKPYTQKADIYSLGMIMYEMFTGSPPFFNKSHDANLALEICTETRPQFPKQVKYPQLLVELIKKCWDNEPNNRPTAREIMKSLDDTEVQQQYKEAKNYNKTLPKAIRYPNYQSPSGVVWHSKLINTKEITERLKTMGYSEELAFDFTKLKVEESNSDWTNINSNFTEELINQWKSNNFTYKQCKEWMDIGLKPTDCNLCFWLRDTKNLTPEQILNNGNLEQLNQEFFNWWQEQQQVQIEQLSK